MPLEEPPGSRHPTPGREFAAAGAWTEIAGPIGPLYVAWGPAGITEVERAGDPGGFELVLATRPGGPWGWVDRMPAPLAALVDRAVRGEHVPALPLDLDHLTAFEQAALRATRQIPWGEVRPYAWVAREIGRPRAVRAVGSALARNPLPFLIPCHRVVRTDGHIGEYGAGGPEAKRALLRLEGLDPDALDALADAGIRCLGDGSTEIFCVPTCGRLGGVPEPARVRFRSGTDALAAGWSPCPACRPLVGSPFVG